MRQPRKPAIPTVGYGVRHREATLGSFDKLINSVRKPHHARLAESLDPLLQRIVGAKTGAAPGPEEMLRLLGELDRECGAFIDGHDVGRLSEAVAHWARHVASPDVVSRVAARFRDNRWFVSACGRLGQQGTRRGVGLLGFQLALQNAGVLQGPTLVESMEELEPPAASPIDAIVDLLWPMADTEEEALRARVAQLSSWDVLSVAWELSALRLEILHAACDIAFDDEASYTAVFDQISPRVNDRLRGVRRPENFSAWKDDRRERYLKMEPPEAPANRKRSEEELIANLGVVTAARLPRSSVRQTPRLQILSHNRPPAP